MDQEHPDRSELGVLPWDRWWCPRGGTVRVDEDGLLSGPYSGISRHLQPDVVTSEAFDAVPCVIQIGEAGMGKSYELRGQASRAEEEGSAVLFRDLRQYDSTEAVRRDIFDGQVFRQWIASASELTLILDSLDEALLEIGVLAVWLVERLKECPTERLRLRIACRSADLPKFFETALRELWDGRVEVYELAPLTRDDVALAARVAEVDPELFFADLAHRGVGPLAAKPTTLLFLLQAFSRGGTLPKDRLDLYRVGCTYLCREDEERSVSGRGGSLDAKSRLGVARRVAAATIFGNKAAVQQRADPGDVKDADVPLEELTGGVEPVRPTSSVSVTREAVEEVLGSGLFSSRGVHRLGWAHQSYAEFLAAEWVVRHSLSVSQIKSLIQHPNHPDGRFVPQLRETVAWLASMSPAVRELVLVGEPDVILESDPTSVTDQERERAVVGILDGAADRTLLPPPWGKWRRFHRLKYPGIAHQLRGYVRDEELGRAVRELAIRIGTAAEASELQADCVELALDESQPLELRVEAARLVAAIGDSEAQQKLKPLALSPQEEDIDDDLKGTALDAIWPDFLTHAELFGALTAPKRSNRYGAYAAFLSKVADGLSPEGLVLGLRWARDLRRESGSRRQLADAIVRRAWEYVEQPDVLDAFAELAAARFDRHENLVRYEQEGFNSAVSKDAQARRILVRALVLRMGPDVDRVLMSSLHGSSALVRPNDLDWVFAQTIDDSLTPEEGRAWANLLRMIADVTDPQVFAELFRHKDSPHIDERFGPLWKPIPLESPVANRLRGQHRRLKELEESRTARTDEAAQVSPSERVRRILGRDLETTTIGTSEDSGDTWCQVAVELTRAEGKPGFRPLQSLDKGPTWTELGHTEQEYLLNLAEHFLQAHVRSVPAWTAEGRSTLGAWAGDRAFRLLQACRPESIEEVPPWVWTAWTPQLVRNRPFASSEDAIAVHEALLRSIRRRDPDGLIAAIIDVLREEDAEYGGSLPSLKHAAAVWDRRLETALLDLAAEPHLTPTAFQTLLGSLIKHDVSGAVGYAESLLEPPLPRGGQIRERVVAAATSLLCHAPDGAWGTVYPVLRRASKFRREVALNASREGVALERFSEEQLAEMFAWLTTEFPYPDPWYEGVYSPTAEDEARSWRSQVVTHLRERGTPEAVGALTRLQVCFPDLDWLSQTVLRAEVGVRRATWTPPRVPDLIELAQGKTRRLIESGEHLLSVLLESLERFEAELHGELPAVSTLWDDLDRDGYRPKSEEAFSDALARHFRRDLQRRGVIAGREVSIRRGSAGGIPGQRTDLHVSAARTAPDASDDIISVVVEVKGCWHNEVLTAMESQLLGRYLARNPECRHGLYVVGWYLSDLWVGEARRTQCSRLGSMEELAALLSSQAEDLSGAGRSLQSVVLDVRLR